MNKIRAKMKKQSQLKLINEVHRPSQHKVNDLRHRAYALYLRFTHGDDYCSVCKRSREDQEVTGS